MLAVFLFVLFLSAYAWLFVPSRTKTSVKPLGLADGRITLEIEPENIRDGKYAVFMSNPDSVAIVLEGNVTVVPPKTVAKGMPVDELVITPEELESLLPITDEPAPAEEISESEPQLPIAPNYSEMTTHQLRKACQDRGIRYRWRKGGKNRYLSQDEMREALLK